MVDVPPHGKSTLIQTFFNFSRIQNSVILIMNDLWNFMLLAKYYWPWAGLTQAGPIRSFFLEIWNVELRTFETRFIIFSSWSLWKHSDFFLFLFACFVSIFLGFCEKPSSVLTIPQNFIFGWLVFFCLSYTELVSVTWDWKNCNNTCFACHGLILHLPR